MLSVHIVLYYVKRFQPSETKKWEAVQVLMILVLKEGLELFVSQFVTF